MRPLRGLAEMAYAAAMARPTSNVGIDAIEGAIQTAVDAMADALEKAREIVRTAQVEAADHADRCRGLAQLERDAATCMDTIRAALKLAGRIP